MQINLAGLHERLTIVERTITQTILPDMKNAAEQRETMLSQNEEILAFVSGVKKTGGYLKRYGPKAITFGAGIMTAAGIGNPTVNAYITSFFGG